MPNISDINGVAIASLGDFNGVAKASITDINGVTIVVSGTNLLLDTYTGAAAAYSVRLLDKDYSGSCMRIRRDSDDSETDIGFDSSGDLDTSAISTFAGSANAYCVTWYDQSGNSKNLSKSTQSYQPKIYNGTSVETDASGKPQLVCTNDNMTGGPSYGGSNVSFFAVARLDTNSVIAGGDGDNGVYIISQIGVNNDGLGSFTSETVFVDNVEDTTKTRDSIHDNMKPTGMHLLSVFATAGSSNFKLGYNPDGVLGIRGELQEMILFTSEESSNRTGIETDINNYFQIGNFPNPTSGLLSTYTGAAAAYSVRQLANTAALCMRVRRDNDDAEQDFGFDANGDLDTAAIATFVGSGNNGYVSKWYDQSGNQNDAEQSTNGSQPQIYNGSAVITVNGKPAVDFSAATTINLTLSIWYTASQAHINFYSVYEKGSSANFEYLLGSNDQDKGYLSYGRSHKPRAGALRTDGFTYAEGNAITVGNQLLRLEEITRTSITIFQNASQSVTLADVSADFVMPSTNLIIGSGNPSVASAAFSGAMQEVIFFTADQSSNRSGIETDINNYFSIY